MYKKTHIATVADKCKIALKRLDAEGLNVIW